MPRRGTQRLGVATLTAHVQNTFRRVPTTPIHTDPKEIFSPNHSHPFPLPTTPFLLFKHPYTPLPTSQHHQTRTASAHTPHAFFSLLEDKQHSKFGVVADSSILKHNNGFIFIYNQSGLSPENIKRVLRFKEQTPEVETNYATRQRTDQRLDEVLPDLCISRATWKLGSGKPAQPIQLRRAELTPLAHGWHEFIIHSIIPTSNRSEITIGRAILIHSIIKGEDVRAEELIADNIAVIAQGMQGKGKLAFRTTIYKLCKDAQVPLHEFSSSRMKKKKISQCLSLKEVMRKAMIKGSTNILSNNFSNRKQVFQQNFWEKQQQGVQLINEQLVGMQLQQQQFFENMQNTQAQYLEELKTVKARQDELWNNINNFHH
ncbi:hypothetical protein PIB30_087160 [Stylosanthes scabra]|uniref:Putative plant transposon protein domain-containing protein n=1 Tax=Stylosanthes scabra TaxID=79078 RepID=A0ABU6XR31_9FABA|nr:hypothetical protein [Stylosanthes scabra]